MEKTILNIINNLEKFTFVDFDNDSIDNINSLSENHYIVQLRNNRHNIENDTKNFNSKADILISYDDVQINIYTKISEKYVESEIQNLINSLYKKFPVKNRMSNRPNIIRFDTLNLS